MWVILLVLVVGSALTVVWIKHEVRLTSTQLYKTVKEDYALRVEQGRLELEYNHLLSRTRIDHIAKEKLGMVAMTPVQERVLLLRDDVSNP